MYIRVHPMRDSVYACTGTYEWSIDHIYTWKRGREGRTGSVRRGGGGGGRGVVIHYIGRDGERESKG